MDKCIGVCSKCGRCMNAALMKGANSRKTRMLAYPQDFVPDTGGEGYGLAVDIGTTTVVGMLWDLQKGMQLAVEAETNPQNEFGMDVISRITFCGGDEEKVQVLQSKITGCINNIVNKLCKKTEIKAEEILRCTVCGNTTMSHLFAGYDPKSLALAPFLPAYDGILEFVAGEKGLTINGGGRVTVLPNIAGHVGGDITAGIAASRILSMTGTTLFMDIGTNGELVISDETGALAASTAAGPAFEGAAIKHGMRAAEGAIERVHIADGDVEIKTVGDKPPQGICGSGLIDVIAQMLENKLINRSGKLASAEDADKGKVDAGYSDRLIKEDGERCFVLVCRENGEHITITQKDVREVQLAKGAVAAGVKIMLAKLGKTIEQIDRIIIAGAFGNYIDKNSAVRIGLLPALDAEKIISAGNTAGAGVSMALACAEEMNLAADAAMRVKHVDLAEEKDFQDTYIASMAF